MPAAQPPRSTPLMLAAEFLPPGTLPARRAGVTHSGDLRRGEHLQLPHKTITPQDHQMHRPRSAINGAIP
jgi:hypothetical protein